MTNEPTGMRSTAPRRPLIGLSSRRWAAAAVGTALPPAYADAMVDVGVADYPMAVADAGGLPVHLAPDAPPDEMVARLDGLVLTGGADVDPATYGRRPSPVVGPTEPSRDAWELALLAAAIERAVPVLAVCRGMQLVNVAYGGTLVEDLAPGDGDDHARFARPRFATAHPVALVPGTLAARVYGVSPVVNSLHHQAVDRLGAGLVVAGRSPDGTVEALEVPGVAVLALQWHPEALAHDPAAGWLVQAARQRAASGR